MGTGSRWSPVVRGEWKVNCTGGSPLSQRCDSGVYQVVFRRWWACCSISSSLRHGGVEPPVVAGAHWTVPGSQRAVIGQVQGAVDTEPMLATERLRPRPESACGPADTDGLGHRAGAALDVLETSPCHRPHAAPSWPAGRSGWCRPCRSCRRDAGRDRFRPAPRLVGRSTPCDSAASR